MISIAFEPTPNTCEFPAINTRDVPANTKKLYSSCFLLTFLDFQVVCGDSAKCCLEMIPSCQVGKVARPSKPKKRMGMRAPPDMDMIPEFLHNRFQLRQCGCLPQTDGARNHVDALPLSVLTARAKDRLMRSFYQGQESDDDLRPTLLDNPLTALNLRAGLRSLQKAHLN